jgi:hypothetical protein
LEAVAGSEGRGDSKKQLFKKQGEEEVQILKKEG